MPAFPFVELVKNWIYSDDADPCDISKKEANHRGFWDVVGKLTKKMGFLVTAASFVTWFVEPAYLPEVMATLYLATMLIICYENRKKSVMRRDSSTEQIPSSISHSFTCLLSDINPYVKGIFISIVFFNIATYWVFRLGHVFNTPLLNFPARLLPYMLAITVVSVACGVGKIWQCLSDNRIKNCSSEYEKIDKIDTFNVMCSANRRIKSLIRGSSEWLLVMHNSFFLLLSCFSLGFFTLGRLSQYTIGALTTASCVLATRVSLTTNKFSSAYLMRKIACNSDYLSYQSKKQRLTFSQTIDSDNNDAIKPT